MEQNIQNLNINPSSATSSCVTWDNSFPLSLVPPMGKAVGEEAGKAGCWFWWPDRKILQTLRSTWGYCIQLPSSLSPSAYTSVVCSWTVSTHTIWVQRYGFILCGIWQVMCVILGLLLGDLPWAPSPASAGEAFHFLFPSLPDNSLLSGLVFSTEPTAQCQYCNFQL